MANFILLLALSGFLLLSLFIFGIEKIAVFSFRLCCSFLFLYIVHILMDDFDIFIPINIFSASIIAILGVPGILCIGVLTIVQ